MSTSEQTQLQFAEPDDYNADDLHGGVNLADEPPHPINWYLLTADEAEFEWFDLDRWVKALKNSYGLPPAVVPPFWHRHDELVWELSALHTHWLNAYDAEGSPSAPVAWCREFHEGKNRLRDLVSACGTKLDRDRPTRVTTWPGETPVDPGVEVVIADRDADFVLWVAEDVAARRRIEEDARVMSRAS